MNMIVALAVLLAQQTERVTLGTLAPKDSPWHKVIQDMKVQWEKGVAGRIKVNLQPGGTMGDEPDMVRKMKAGVIQAAALTGVGLSEIVPEIKAMQMPMMLRDYDELDYVMGKAAPKLESALKNAGFIVLHWGDAGWVHFFAKTPVVTLDDLRKQKLFVWASSTTEVDIWKNAGCKPVPLAATEIHTGLSSGLITAYSTTPIAALSFQWFGHTKNMTDMKWAPLIGATVIHKSCWDKFTADEQTKLLKSAESAGAAMKAEVRRIDATCVAEMKKRGLTAHAVPDGARVEWEKQARDVWPKIAKEKSTADLVAEVEMHANEFRAKKGSK